MKPQVPSLNNLYYQLSPDNIGHQLLYNAQACGTLKKNGKRIRYLKSNWQLSSYEKGLGSKIFPLDPHSIW